MAIGSLKTMIAAFGSAPRWLEKSRANWRVGASPPIAGALSPNTFAIHESAKAN